MLERCPDSKPVSVATLPNYKLVFVGWSRQWRGGTASIKPLRGERVLGALCEVSEKCLGRLDGYEGPGYRRIKVRVFDEGGNAVEAVTYIKAEQSDETEPSREYVSIMQQGFKDWGITS